MIKPVALTFAAALALAAPGLAQTPPAARDSDSPASQGAGADRTRGAPAPGPTAPQTMGQVPHKRQPDPLSRNRNDCNKTNCVDNGGG
ncbi:hypothetical protein DFR50_10880 [Roseiarcus fermentans]|uniref:Uncharacterized protein n=1 Tax=Roseiarcus fermentans TaxID=1473586 RepID=A0A366FLE6_9HYPH|nr:hypothetical protein [Roseiarcus fermentans]RBP15523.1 hypothetical protein DFR50_10880 [Roseiarcus fermentans]